MNRPTLAAIAFLFLAAAAPAAEWPTYRADAARSGYTPEELPDELSLSWTYRGPHPPMRAWPGLPRMQFDRAYRVVVSGGGLYFGSSADCKVVALDAHTGKTRWTFFTDGPVRFAPLVWEDRVFVASDDGYLYCLGAAGGKLIWKIRGGPKVDMLLGNERMMSRWPVRGGPAVLDGVLYFAAGIWPTEGIYIYAVDPRSGKVLWCNDSSGAIEMDQPHGGARAKSGVSAQGYMVADADRLFVPTGRAVPALFGRADGKLRYFHLQKNTHAGGAEVVAIDDHFYNAGLMFSAADGVRRAALGQLVAANPKFVFYCRGNKLIGLDRQKLWLDKEVIDRKGKKQIAKTLAPPVWTTELPLESPSALIVAGGSVIVGGEDEIAVVDIESKRTTWSGATDGTASDLAVADGRLYVSTDRGEIACFDGAASKRPAGYKPKRLSVPAETGSLCAAAAKEILSRTGVEEGYCLDLGCGDGRLALELARRTNLRICAVSNDPAKVRAARDLLDAAGLYGVRVTVHQADPVNVPYPNWFADLVVSARSLREGAGIVAAASAARMQRPAGGVVCLGRPGAMEVSVAGPLDDIGSWTHQYAGPANSLCSDDKRLRGPLAMLWFRDTDFFMPNRHGRGPAPLVCDGRMFAEGVDALRAINIYNGRILWEYPLEGILKPYHQEHLMGAAGTGSNICTAGGRVFVARGDRCLVLAVEDGSKLDEFRAPPRADGKPGTWGYLAFEAGTLLGSLAATDHVVKYPYGKSDMSRLFTESVLLFALDGQSGKLKWTYRPDHFIRHNAVATGGGRVYLIDRPPAAADTLGFDKAKAQAKAKRRAQAAKPGTDAAEAESREYRRLTEHKPGRLRALDQETGKVVWETGEDVFGTMLALSTRHDVLLVSYQPTRFRLKSELGGRMAALRASKGTRLWDIEAEYASRPILNDRTIYAQPGAWDLLTGKRLPFEFSRSYGCGILAGSARMLVFRSATIGYVDLLGTKQTENYGGIRPGCWVNAIPAGGLLLLADAASWCRCSYLNQATIALQPGGEPAGRGVLGGQRPGDR